MIVPLRRITEPTIRILSVFIDNPNKTYYGLDLVSKSRVSDTTVYTVLDRLEEYGWLEGAWEKTPLSEISRPARRYYRLTKQGRRQTIKTLSIYEFKKHSRDLLQLSGQNYKLKPNPLKVHWREDNLSVEENSVLCISKYEIEFPERTPCQYQLRMHLKMKTEQNPIDIEKLIVNRVDHTGNIKLQNDKTTINLKDESQTCFKSITIPSNFASSGSNLELELAIRFYRNSDESPPLIPYFDLPTDNWQGEIRSLNKIIRPAIRNNETGEDEGFITSRIGDNLDGVLDIKESESAVKGLQHKDGIVKVKLRKPKLGYNYSINTELIDPEDKSQTNKLLAEINSK